MRAICSNGLGNPCVTNDKYFKHLKEHFVLSYCLSLWSFTLDITLRLITTREFHVHTSVIRMNYVFCALRNCEHIVSMYMQAISTSPTEIATMKSLCKLRKKDLWWKVNRMWISSQWVQPCWSKETWTFHTVTVNGSVLIKLLLKFYKTRSKN